MENLDEQLRDQILRRIPGDLRKQLRLPEDVDVFCLLGSLLVQVHHAFNAIMHQPRSEYAGKARRWMGCFARLARTYQTLRELRIQEVPPEVFDLRLKPEIMQGLSEWLEEQRCKLAA